MCRSQACNRTDTTLLRAIANTLHSALWHDLGGTANPHTGRLIRFRTGYLVSRQRFGHCFERWPNPRVIEKWLDSVALGLEEHRPQLYPGIWLQTMRPFKVWCDLNEHVRGESLALAIGQREAQKCIRDIEHRRNVLVPREYKVAS